MKEQNRIEHFRGDQMEMFLHMREVRGQRHANIINGAGVTSPHIH